MSKYAIVYEGAFLEDGEPYFPQKLGREKLAELRRDQGPYMFANQYMNITLPDEDQDFKKAWLKYYTHIPENTYTFILLILPYRLEMVPITQQQPSYVLILIKPGI